MYKAKNIDTDKFLEELERIDKDAHYTHVVKNKIEEARFEQEHKTLNQIMDMFYCSNYEKQENNNDTVTITKAQYDEYLSLANEADSYINCIMEEDLTNFTKEVGRKLMDCLKSEEYLICGADGKKNICNISYEELDKVLAFAFSCTIDEFKNLVKG